MTKILDRVSEHPLIVLLMTILFTLALSLFIAKVSASDLPTGSMQIRYVPIDTQFYSRLS